MSRGYNNPNAAERPSPAIDWNAVEWYVYRTPVAANANFGGFDYRVTARKLSPGELRAGEELACTVSRTSLAAVRGFLNAGIVPEGVQRVVDTMASARSAERERDDAPFRARMAERRAAAQAAFEARMRKAEQRLAEDVARAGAA